MTYNSSFSSRVAVAIVVSAACCVLFSASAFAQKASYGQQVAVMKALKADLKTIGVIGLNLSDKMTQDLTRAGLQQGVTIVIAKPKDPREVATLYKTLVSGKKIQMLWLPETADEVVTSVSFDFLKENSLMDRIGLCVPEKKLVPSGVLCAVQIENGKLIVYANKKIASVVGVTIPGEGSDIPFVSQ
jgi:hypothetical protein